MAGGKETTRQKMISMMYLVLTAMLALNVSSAILQKFEKINQSLEYSRGQASGSNAKFLESMDKLAHEPAAPPNASALMQQANEVKKKTDEIVAYLETVKQELVTKVGEGKGEDGLIKNKEGQTKVEEEMLGQGQKGKAYEMRNKLNEYTEFMTRVMGKPVDALALDGKDDPLTKKDPNQNKKDFAALNFEQTPVVAALAVISEKQSEAVRFEAEALTMIAQKLGKVEIKPDKVEVGMSADAMRVAAGTKYHAEMFLAAGFSGISPVMTYNGANVPVANGRGKVEFKVDPSNGTRQPDGTFKKQWTGKILFKTASGRDTAFTKTFDYYVVTPSLQISSASVQALYIRCANELSVQVPELGAEYNPAFSAPGCQVVPGGKKGLVTLIPSAMTPVTLSVSSGGAAIGSQQFSVRAIPKPSVEVFANGRAIDQKIGFDVVPSQLQARALADEGFKAALPNDAKYRVNAWKVYLVRGKRPVTTIDVSGDIANLGGIKGQAKPGDRIVIEIIGVQRMDYKGGLEPTTPAGSKTFTLPVN
jgi:gliding motility-associated protein GldM